MANVDVLLIFGKGEPAGPFEFSVPPTSMHHYEFAELTRAAPVTAATRFCAVLTSDNPVVVQHVRHASLAETDPTVSTLAFPG